MAVWPAARRFAWDSLARSLRCWTSISHNSSSSGPNRSLGISSRTTRYTWGLVNGCPDLVAEARGAGVPTGLLESAMRGRSAPGDTRWMRGGQRRGVRGHTVMTMQAGLWAAITPLNFEGALIALVNSGGDTDTNGALAGAVLGARYGASAIPLRWTTHVSQRDRLTDLADRLAQL